MQTGFRTILVPVDFSVNTEVAISKAIELCDGPNATIHLLHVMRVAISGMSDIFGFFGRNSTNSLGHHAAMQRKMRYWMNFIQEANPGINTCSWVRYETSVEKAIYKKTREIRADLIVIGKNSQHRFFPFLNTVISSRIARKTHTAVLTVKPGSFDRSLKMVVVPFGEKFPEEKIEMINALRSKFRVHIRLLMLVEKGNDPDVLQISLLNVCQVLRSYQIDNISYEVIASHNKAWDILRYSWKVNADMLIVNPGVETKMSWFNKHLSDELPVQSQTQVLAISNA